MESLDLREIDRRHRSCWMACLNWYRGYDSAGLAVRDGKNLAQVVKAKGRLSNLIEKTDGGKALKEPVVLVILVGQLTVSRAKPMHIRMFQVTVPVLVLVQWSLSRWRT